MFLLFVRYLHGGQEDVSAMVGRALTKTQSARAEGPIVTEEAVSKLNQRGLKAQ